jgi:hypothetical protein
MGDEALFVIKIINSIIDRRTGRRHPEPVPSCRWVAPSGTRVSLSQIGWGDGEDWDAVHAPFDQAWDEILRRLQYSFAVGPFDWSDPEAVRRWGKG